MNAVSRTTIAGISVDIPAGVYIATRTPLEGRAACDVRISRRDSGRVVWTAHGIKELDATAFCREFNGGPSLDGRTWP